MQGRNVRNEYPEKNQYVFVPDSISKFFWSVSVLLHYSLFKDVNLSLRAVDNPQTTEVAAPGFSFETWHLTVFDGRTLDKLTGMERHRYDVSRRHMHEAIHCFVNQIIHPEFDTNILVL